MIRLFHYYAAKFFFIRLKNRIEKDRSLLNEENAKKWNRLQGTILTKGRIKIKWKKIFLKKQKEN